MNGEEQKSCRSRSPLAHSKTRVAELKSVELSLGERGGSREAADHLLFRRWALQPFHRLRSIAADVEFVSSVAEKLEAPLLANLRCGLWYVPSEKRLALAHFKSGDGHYGQWSFSVRRSNLHLLEILDEHGKVIVVDATRTGKRFPDALSKTLPIWVCVLNRSLFGDDSEPLVLPPWVPQHEKWGIEAKLDDWVRDFRRYTAHFRLPRLKKRLGVLWLHRGSTMLDSYGHLPFTPLFALSASMEVPEGERVEVEDYCYIPGAGDDAETWSLGLTPDLFHAHARDLMAGGATGCEQRIRKLVAQTSTSGSGNALNGHSLTPGLHFRLWETGVAMGTEESLQQPGMWSRYEKVIALENATVQDPDDSSSCAVLRFPLLNLKGKPDFKYGLGRALPKILEVLRSTSNVMVVAPVESDAALATGIAFLVSQCAQNPDGSYARQQLKHPPTKDSVHIALLSVANALPYPLTLSRHSLKQVHRVVFRSAGSNETEGAPLEKNS